MKITEKFLSSHAVVPWMIIVAIIPMLVICTIIYYIARDILRSETQRTVSLLIQKEVETIDNYIQERKLNAVQLSRMPILERSFGSSSDTTVDISQNFGPVARYFSYITRDIGFSNIIITDVNGKILYNKNDQEMVGKTIVANEPRYEMLFHAFDGAKTLMIPYVTSFMSQPDRKPNIYISVPVFAGDVIRGVLILPLDLQEISNVIKQRIGLGDLTTLLGSLVDNKVEIVLRTEAPPGFDDTLSPATLESLKAAIKGNTGLRIITQSNRPDLLVAYSYVPQLNMGILSEYSTQEIFKRSIRLRNQIIGLITTSLLFVLGVVWWISLRLSRTSRRNEELLLNILPQPVINELEEKGFYRSRLIKSVSVIFADVVDFSKYARVAKPEELTQFLSEIFTKFDEIADQYYIEKIKTIGDAYMAVAGLQREDKYHANHALDFGLSLIRAIEIYSKKHNANFRIRVGIHSGSVTAGIISAKKFSYDLWGNEVNTASRMEESGEPQAVQISEETYKLLVNKDQYEISELRVISVKGIGDIHTYIVTGKKS